MDDRCSATAGGGRLITQKRTERMHVGQQERGYGQDAWRASNPAESWRGGKGGTKTITDEKHRNLKIGTESRDQFSLCSVTGTPPPNNE